MLPLVAALTDPPLHAGEIISDGEGNATPAPAHGTDKALVKLNISMFILMPFFDLRQHDGLGRLVLFRATSSIGSQSRVFPGQRSGCRSLAFRYT